MPSVCLISSGQPSSNPRLIKEADALAEEGFEVRVICSHWADWADRTDNELLTTKPWGPTTEYVGGELNWRDRAYTLSRVRHKFSNLLSRKLSYPPLIELSLCRTASELVSAARKARADLYIAHNLGALPAAVHAASFHHSLVGFDAEDFHSGMEMAPSRANAIAEKVERRLLAKCNYVTAASTGIAKAYAEKYGISEPHCIWNVFPLSTRPESFHERNHDEKLTLFWFSQTVGSQRGIEDVIEAMAQLKEEKLELHLLGAVSESYRRELIQKTKDLGITGGRITFHDPIPPNEVVRKASQFDVGLALELAEPLNRDICVSNKIFTYTLGGCAIAATLTRGQAEILQSNPAASFLFKSGDVASLTDGLRAWYYDREKLTLARRASWEVGTTRFNWDLEKKKFLRVVDSVLNSRQKFSVSVG